MPAINPGAGASNGPQQHQRTTFRPPWVKEGPEPLPMPAAPWTLNRPRPRGKSQQVQDNTHAATVQDILQSSNTLLLQAGSWAAGVGITISGIPNSLSYFATLHKNLHMGRGFNTTGFKKCFSKTGSASIIRIKTKGKSTVVSAHAIKVCGRGRGGGTAALILT